MKDIYVKFLTVLCTAVRGGTIQDPALLCAEELPEILHLAHIHHLSPLVYNQIGKSESFLSLDEDIREPFRKSAVRLMTAQTMRTIHFLQILREMQEAGIDPVVVKGIVVRNLYPKPDQRPSADEDLLISEETFILTDRFLKEHGYITDFTGEEVPYEAGYKNLHTGVYLEVHTSLFEKNSELFSSYCRILEEWENRTVRMEADGVSIRTLSYEDHLLYLTVHAAKHFRYSGIGIRQILDIIVFTEHFHREIDFGDFFRKISDAGLFEFSDSIYDIAEKYLGFSRKNNSMPVKENIPDHEDLLQDILEGGAYGTASEIRRHSSNMTLSEDMHHGILQALFPSREYMEKKYPYVKEKKFGLPLAYAERIFRYVSGNDDLLAPLRTGKERSDLIGRYSDPEIRYDTAAYMENIRAALKNGQEATVPVVGNSMIPFLANERDRVILRSPDRHLKPGDIILYQRDNGKYILHRIIRIHKDLYNTAGDNENVCDKNIRLSQIFGYVIRINRKGKWIDETDPVWKFFSNVWIRMVPLHKGIIQGYTGIASVRKKNR